MILQDETEKVTSVRFILSFWCQNDLFLEACGQGCHVSAKSHHNATKAMLRYEKRQMYCIV